MVRLLFWIALIAAAFWLWRKFKISQQSHPEQKLDDPLKMVRCAHCGVHLPNDRALQQGKDWYCSQAHLQQGPGQPVLIMRSISLATYPSPTLSYHLRPSPLRQH